ncbi:MAG TPA: hypothetical protein DEV98_01315 [Clostridiales bacterium]|nr:hypothetical protein [Clostridiales bacterium]
MTSLFLSFLFALAASLNVSLYSFSARKASAFRSVFLFSPDFTMLSRFFLKSCCKKEKNAIQ